MFESAGRRTRRDIEPEYSCLRPLAPDSAQAVRRHLKLDQGQVRRLHEILLLSQLPPEGPQRDEAELPFQVALLTPLFATRFGSAEGERAAARALELSRRVGADLRSLFRALYGLTMTYSVRGKIRTGREIAEQLLTGDAAVSLRRTRAGPALDRFEAYRSDEDIREAAAAVKAEVGADRFRPGG